MKRHLYVCLFATALACCGPKGKAPERVVRGQSAPPAVPDNRAVPPAPAAKQPTVDPKSTDAATELVKGFVDLLNQGKFDEAYMLLGPNAQPRTKFDQTWRKIDNLHVSAGKPGDQEGAAGSIYLSVPLTVSGSIDGTQTNRSATAVLRRVNDVPGSTEAQRHWHIERIDWGSAA